MSNVSQNDNLDTTNHILKTLKAPHSLDNATIDTALHYLFSTQNEDGDWGGRQGEESSIFMTAMTIMTLQQFSQTAELADSITKAVGYLVTKQNQNGGFGPVLSTAHDTALAYIVLARVPIDAKALNNSWDDDAYSTALVLRALCCSESDAMQISQPEKEGIIGQSPDGLTNMPLEDTSADVKITPEMVKEGINGQLRQDQTVEMSGSLNASAIGGQGETLNTEESRESIPVVKVETVQREDKRKVSLLARRKASAYVAQESGIVAINETPTFDPPLSIDLPLAIPGSIIGKVFDDVSKGPVKDVSITLEGGLSAKTDSPWGICH